MRYRWGAVLGLLALVGCGGPAVTMVPTVVPTAIRSSVSPTAPMQATATLVPTATITPMPTSILPTAVPPTNTPRPDLTATPEAPPEPPTAPAVPLLRSGGIGLTRPAWERAHQRSQGSGALMWYDSNHLLVTFSGDMPPVVSIVCDSTLALFTLVAAITPGSVPGRWPWLRIASSRVG